MDGNGTLFGTVAGNTREVIQKFTVDLPKKHGRGGQSALRFARLRDEKRHNYVRKVAELAVQHFITNDKVNVTGLVLAGFAAGVWAYSIGAVKQDDFDDVDDEDTQQLRRQWELRRPVSERTTSATATSTYLATTSHRTPTTPLRRRSPGVDTSRQRVDGG